MSPKKGLFRKESSLPTVFGKYYFHIIEVIEIPWEDYRQLKGFKL